jgi:hypothetical protein
VFQGDKKIRSGKGKRWKRKSLFCPKEIGNRKEGQNCKGEENSFLRNYRHLLPGPVSLGQTSEILLLEETSGLKKRWCPRNPAVGGDVFSNLFRDF